ncbi:MAG: tetratricopeptide repeat protein, partial [Acidobacteriota bacterium]
MTDLGATLRNLQQPREALELFKRVSDQRPDHWQALFNQVLILAFDLGDLDSAGVALDSLRSLQPTNPDVQRLATEVEKLRAS